MKLRYTALGAFMVLLPGVLHPSVRVDKEPEVPKEFYYDRNGIPPLPAWVEDYLPAPDLPPPLFASMSDWFAVYKDDRQAHCMARNIYFESANQGVRGQIAVGQATMNRVKDQRFPKTICDVVHQKTGPLCQFSWICTHAGARVDDRYKKIFMIAIGVIRGDVYEDIAPDALFFHHVSLGNIWPTYTRVAVEQDHVFYKIRRVP